uniref:Lipolytic protein G-D-S-L family n=1 Tax=Geobacter sp. (strain M21) TaxID=443144 RepID=C6E968_GEOSM
MFNLRYFTLIALFAILLLSCQKEKEPAAVNATEKPASRGTIVAVGDSLTAGYGVPETDAYPARLERKLDEAGYKWRVVNAGISGETSTGALARIDWILKLQPDIVILETGANDGMRGQDPELTRKNIDRIVSALQAKNVVVVLAGMQMLTNMGSPYRDKFVAVYPRVAKERKLILVPFFLDKVAGEENLNLSDGIHPNPQGYAIVTETIFPYVLQAIKLKTGS